VVLPSPVLSSTQPPFQVGMQVPALVAYLALISVAAVMFPVLFWLRRGAVVSWPVVLAANTPDAPPAVVAEAQRQLAAGRRFVWRSNAAVGLMTMCGCAVVLGVEHGWCGSALALVHTFQVGVVFGDAEAGYGRWFENVVAIGCTVALYVTVNLAQLATAINGLAPEAPADAFARPFIRTTGRIVSQVAITVSMYLIQFLIAYARERTHRFVFLAGTTTVLFHNHLDKLKAAGSELVASQLPTFVVESQRHVVVAAQLAALNGSARSRPAHRIIPTSPGASDDMRESAPSASSSAPRHSHGVRDRGMGEERSGFTSSDAVPSGAAARHVVLSLDPPSTGGVDSDAHPALSPPAAPAIAGTCTVLFVSVAAPIARTPLPSRGLQAVTVSSSLVTHVEAVDAAYRLCDELALEAGVDKVKSTGHVW